MRAAELSEKGFDRPTRCLKAKSTANGYSGHDDANRVAPASSQTASPRAGELQCLTYDNAAQGRGVRDPLILEGDLALQQVLEAGEHLEPRALAAARGTQQRPECISH